MNHSTRYIIYTLFAILNLGFPLLSMKLTNGLSSDVKFFVAIVIVLVMTVANVIFNYWYCRYDFLKCNDTESIILSVMPKFDFRKVAQSMRIELIAMIIGSLIFAYGFGTSNMIIMVVGLIAWWLPFDRIIDKTVELFEARIKLVIAQIKS